MFLVRTCSCCQAAMGSVSDSFEVGSNMLATGLEAVCNMEAAE
jgi:hypothetical protein